MIKAGRWFHFLIMKRGTLGFAVLDNFSCDISVILILNYGIAVFSNFAGCGFLAFWTG